MISEHGPQSLHIPKDDRAAYERHNSEGAFTTARFTEVDFRTGADEAEIGLTQETPLPKRLSHDPVYEIVGALRDMFGGFVVNNLRTSPKAGFREPTQDFPSADSLLEGVMSATQALTQIYHALNDRSALSLNYRAIIVNATGELKAYLLGLTQFDTEGGINRSDLPHILGACIEAEKAMAAHIHQMDILKSGLGGHGE